MNPNFQAKLEGKTPKGYSNHSLLSAYIFYCMVVADKNRKLSPNDIIGLIVLIAKHHGNPSHDDDDVDTSRFVKLHNRLFLNF